LCGGRVELGEAWFGDPTVQESTVVSMRVRLSVGKQAENVGRVD
jgi:hypothetical protein